MARKKIQSEHLDEVYLRGCVEQYFQKYGDTIEGTQLHRRIVCQYVKKHKTMALWLTGILTTVLVVLVDDKSINIVQFIKRLITGTL